MVNKKMVQCMTAIILSGIMLCTGCGKVDNTASNQTSMQSDSTYSCDLSWQQDLEKEWLPQVEEVVRYNYNYLCYDMNDQQKKLYKKGLLDKGFQLIRQEKISDLPYEYYEDGQKRIVVVDAGEVVIITIADIYDGMKEEEDVTTTEKVLSLMQGEYNDDLKSGKMESEVDYYPEIVVKCYIPDLYEKTKLLAYQGLTKDGRGSDIYLISNDLAYRIEDQLDNICIADVDGDGDYELLSLYGFGSGIYRINLNVYKYSNPICFNGLKEVPNCCYTNCYVPKQGYDNLAFKKITDTEVHLVQMKCIMNEETEKSDVYYGEDYGRLVTDLVNGKIYPEKLDSFPYYEWDQYFVKDTETDDQEEQSKLTDEVPKLTVKVGDQLIENTSWKDNWKGETQDRIRFSDIIKSETEIPQFECPEGMTFNDEICLSFEEEFQPNTIQVKDYLITENGDELYNKAGVVEREVRYGDDGNYYIGLMAHYALYLSSSTNSYTNPSYRGFRVICHFDDEHICEYDFVLSLGPAWKER